MSGENLNTNQGNDENVWDILAEYGKVDQKTERVNDKLDELVKQGKITAERAETLRGQREKAAATERDQVALSEKLYNMENGPAEEFAGEQNLNSRTGKVRSESDFDLYPRMEGESKEEYGARLRQIHAIEREYEEGQAALEAALSPDRERAEFEGERNIRIDKKGEEHQRTYSEFDLYPKLEGETNAAYGERLRRMHEMTRKAEEQARAESAESERAKAREILGESQREVDAIVERERLAAEERERLSAAERERIAAEEAERIKDEEREHEAEGEGDDGIEVPDVPEGEKSIEDMTEEELREAEKDTEDKIRKLREELAELEDRPLVAINADFTHDKHELAHDLAEQDLNEEVSQSGFLKRLWKGTLFKKYYEKKYTNEYIRGERDRDGKTVYDLVEERSHGAIERFVLGAVEDSENSRFVHRRAGESLKEADAETNERIRGAIAEFATAKIPEGGSLEDLKRRFIENIDRFEAEQRDQGKNVDRRMINNYLEVAIQARERAEHGVAIENVMDGFKVYNAEARDNVRTQAHRDNIDKIVNRLESSAIGQFIPGEVLAGAIGMAVAFTQTGARAIGGVAGGILVSSAMSGLKERNRVTEDRARMLRDRANGLEYSGDENVEGRSGRALKTAKYEQRIGGTLYDLQRADSLTENLENALAMEEGEERSAALLRAITEARVRIDFSDSEQKDLISYSSEDRRGDERLALDRVLIRAEKSLSATDATRLEGMKNHLQSEIESNVDERDADFRRTRTALAMKKAGKTLIVGAATFLVSQEIMAAFDPGKIGILEKAGLLKTENAEGASETLLAGIGGSAERAVTSVDTIEVSGDDTTTMNQLEQAGYTRTEVSAGSVIEKQELVEISPASSDAALSVKYDGLADNGTLVSDGNELAAYIDDSGRFVSGMSGTSTFGTETLDYNALASAGDVKGYITIGGAKFEVASSLNEAGQLTWGENGVFTTTTGETIRAIGEDGEKLYKYFEIAVDRGVDADGVQHIVPLATDVGRDSAAVMMQQVSTPIETPPIYEYVKTTTTFAGNRDISMAGVFMPETARTSLGGTRARSGETANIPRTPENPTNTTPNGQSEPAPVEEEPEESAPTEEEPAPEAEEPERPEGETPAEEEENPGNNEGLTEAERQFVSAIERNRDSLGDDGVAILTDTNQFDESNAGRYSAWWDTLDEENKARVRGLMTVLNSRTNIPFGRGFREWYNSLNNPNSNAA